jgi:hypothetical protein
MPKYWITKTRYIKQVGQQEPQLVAASPDVPALVEIENEIPAETQASNGWRAEGKPAPDKLKPAYAAAGRAVAKAQDVQSRRL